MSRIRVWTLTFVGCAVVYGGLVVAAGYAFGEGRPVETIQVAGQKELAFPAGRTHWNLYRWAYAGSVMGRYSTLRHCEMAKFYAEQISARDGAFGCLPTQEGLGY